MHQTILKISALILLASSSSDAAGRFGVTPGNCAQKMNQFLSVPNNSPDKLPFAREILSVCGGKLQPNRINQINTIINNLQAPPPLNLGNNAPPPPQPQPQPQNVVNNPHPQQHVDHNELQQQQHEVDLNAPQQQVDHNELQQQQHEVDLNAPHQQVDHNGEDAIARLQGNDRLEVGQQNVGDDIHQQHGQHEEANLLEGEGNQPPHNGEAEVIPPPPHADNRDPLPNEQAHQPAHEEGAHPGDPRLIDHHEDQLVDDEDVGGQPIRGGGDFLPPQDFLEQIRRGGRPLNPVENRQLRERPSASLSLEDQLRQGVLGRRGAVAGQGSGFESDTESDFSDSDNEDNY